MSMREVMRWVHVGLFAALAACGGDDGGGGNGGGADAGSSADGGMMDGCPSGQQDEDGDGVCNADCPSTDCGNGTCSIDDSGDALCTCDAGFTGDSCDTLDAPSMDNVDFWIDATEGVATEDGGNTLEAWVDRAGNANNGLPGAVSEAPLVIENGLNGLPVVRFDGEDDHLGFENMSALSNNNYTVFVVVRPAEDTLGVLYYATDDNGGEVSADYTSSAIIHYHEAGFVSGDVEMNIEDYGGNAYKNDEFQLYTFRVDNSSVAGWINGNYMYGNYLDGPDDLGANTEFTLGAYHLGGNNFEGDIAEMIIVSEDLHYGERKPIEDYLAAKWFGAAFERQPSALGSTHVWLDASNSDNLTVAEGQVTTWENLGAGAGFFGNGSFPNSRPEVVENALNGHSVVRFDGGDALVQNDVDVRAGGEEGQYTIMAVVVPPGSGEEQLLYRANYANDDERVYEGRYSPSDTGFTFIHRWPSADVGGDVVTGSADAAEAMIVKIERSQEGNFHYVIAGDDGNAAGSELGVSAGVDLHWGLGGDEIDAPGDGFEGDIAEFIVLTNALGAAEEGALVEMLSAKWGLN